MLLSVSCFKRCVLLLLSCLVLFTLPSKSQPLQSENTSVLPFLLSDLQEGQRLAPYYLQWHDESDQATLSDALVALSDNRFLQPKVYHSQGLQKGAIWVLAQVNNDLTDTRQLVLEYVDHQLIDFTLYTASEKQGNYSLQAYLSLTQSFSTRQLAHHRFAAEITFEPKQTTWVLVRLGSDGQGFIFPNLRLWSPDAFAQQSSREVGLLAFLAGGCVVMALFALVTGVSTGIRYFYIYSAYSVSKVFAWGMITGVGHRFFVTDNFDWNYMSLAGGSSILFGIWFTRVFLETRRHVPKIDCLLQIMMANSALLILAALLKIKLMAVLCITVAMLLYPINFIAALIRWRQGTPQAAVFALGWGLLMAGLFSQALRDLGWIEHNLINYYWPPVASFSEVVVIMFAMGMQVLQLRKQKEEVEYRYARHLEHEAVNLEREVAFRTAELEVAKRRAERDAQTDPLTGICNRRSFFLKATALVEKANNDGLNVSLMMFDLDKFKSINDRFGHKTGDDALKLFTQTVKQYIRADDVFARLGGEEFVLLTCRDTQDAEKLAEQLRIATTQIELRCEKGEVKLSTSIGLAHLATSSHIDELLVRADNVLYAAKDTGRNQVFVAS